MLYNAVWWLTLGEYALAVEVKDGPKLLLSKLNSFNETDIMVDVSTSLDISCGLGKEIELVEVAE